MAATTLLSYRPIRNPEPRRDRRMSAPVLQVYVDGERWPTANWSLGGLLVRAYRGPLAPAHGVRGILVGRARGGLQGVPFRASVVRRDAAALALRFDRPDERVLGFLDRCLFQHLGATA